MPLPVFFIRFLRRHPLLVPYIHILFDLLSGLLIAAPACFVLIVYQDITAHQAFIRAILPDADPAALTKQEVFDLQRGGYALMAAALIVIIFADYQHRHGELTAAWMVFIWIVCWVVWVHGMVMAYGKASKVGKATPKTQKQVMEEALWSGYQGILEF